MSLVILAALAFWTGVYSLFGWEGVIVVAGLCTLGTFALVGVEELQARYDRRVALGRLDLMERWEQRRRGGGGVVR